jgi:signal transduction histidine kinase
MIRFITRTNRELAKFIEAIKQEDYSLKYPEIKSKNSIAELHHSFNTIIQTFQQVKIDREIQFNFLQLIIENIEIGILAINEKEEIVLMNSAAEKLLHIRKSKTWRQLKNKAEQFCAEVESIFSGGKKLIEL